MRGVSTASLGRGCWRACTKRSLRGVWRQWGIPSPGSIRWTFISTGTSFRRRLLIDGRLVVEIKSVEKLLAVHARQLLTYLRLVEQPVGLLINFGGETLKEGVRRVVNNPRSSASPRLRVNQNNGE